MNKQQVFDKVYKHLMKQQARSIRHYDNDHGDKIQGCAYRGEGGLMCAVGVLISDDAYSEFLEGIPVTYSDVTDALKRSGVEHAATMKQFLSQLQTVHDCEVTGVWQRLLENIAKEHNLTVPELP